MSYDYPVWEFEQGFTASGTGTTHQPVKERGIWKFVADIQAASTIDPSVYGVGLVRVYKNGVEVAVITPETVGITSTENLRFGHSISIPDYEDGSAPTLVISTPANTYAYRIDTGGTTLGDWENIDDAVYQEVKFNYNTASFSRNNWIDAEGGILHPLGSKLYVISIPKYNSEDVQSISETVIDENTGDAVKKTTSMCWDGSYVWAFTTVSQYPGYDTLTIRAVDVWHYDGSSSFDTYEKLTYEYFFHNHYTFTDPIRYTVIGAVKTGNYLQHRNSVYRANSRFYVAVGPSKIYVFDSTATHIGVIDTPEITTSVVEECLGSREVKEPQFIHSNIVIVDNNLFYSSYQKSASEQNRLWRYHIPTKAWTYELIPGRHQVEPRHIVDGLEGNIWLTNKNNHSVVKVNGTTGVPISSVRVNRHPYSIMVNQSKEVFVASDPGSHWVMRKYYDPEAQGGLNSTNKGGFSANSAQVWKPKETLDVTDGQISVIDQTDDSQDAYCAGRVDVEEDPINNHHGHMFDDGQGYLWFMAPDAFGRLRKSDKELKLWFQTRDPEQEPEDAPSAEYIPGNSTIDHTPYARALASFVTPRFTYQKWDGSQLVATTVKPYFVWTEDGYSFKAVRLSALVRKSKYIHRVTGMVAFGDQAYIGD